MTSFWLIRDKHVNCKIIKMILIQFRICINNCNFF
ncbi:unnamed protein product [Brassica rapa subsp. narinosa]